MTQTIEEKKERRRKRRLAQKAGDTPKPTKTTKRKTTKRKTTKKKGGRKARKSAGKTDDQKLNVLTGNLDADALARATPVNPFFVSASRLKDWMRCRLRYHWRHNLKLEPNEKSEALAVGWLVHKIIETWYAKPQDKRTIGMMERVSKRLTKRTTAEELSVENLELIRAMTIGYAEWAGPLDAKLKIGSAEPELWFDLPLNDEGTIRVRGKIDLVFFTHKKRIVNFHEHKTRKQIRFDLVELNTQLSVYHWALRIKYPDVKDCRGHFNILRKQMPTDRVRTPLFHREPVDRTLEQIEQWRQDAIRCVEDMVRGGIYPSPMESCGWDCDYKSPCMLRGNPEDVREVLARDYKLKEYQA